MDRHEARLVQFLSAPSSYPHPADAVEQRQTHVSRVFLAGRFAYKLKKPVKFPFLDASTLERRRAFCRLEIVLNRRLAPQVYVDVVPVVEGPQGLRLGGRGRVVEWLVKMHRLPEERMLDQLVQRGEVTPRELAGVADRLARFFRSAGRGTRIGQYGEPAKVRGLIVGNLSECGPFVGTLLREADRRFIDAAYRQHLALSEPLLRRRAREGRIIDGHGDLRCENICLTRPPTVFDCIEFQPAFRCGDMANDLAFLLMDLEFRGRPDLARTVLARYQRAICDPTLEAVLPMYLCHRSLVRAKVRALAAQQQAGTPEGRRLLAVSRRHFALARGYAERFAKPRLIVVSGLIGSGKSTLARQLADAFGAEWLRTDEIRLTEFARFRQTGQGFSEGLYADRVSALVYRRLIRRAEQALRQGLPVVCDGTFSRHEGREALRLLAARCGASFHLFQCVVPKRVALRRLARRAGAKSDISEARPEHYDRLAAGFEPVRGWAADNWTRMSDNRPPARTFQAALQVLRRRWASA